MQKILEAGKSRASWHEKGMILKCPRRYALSLGAEKMPTAETLQGSLMRQALAHHYTTEEVADPLTAVDILAVQGLEQYPDLPWQEKADIVKQVYSEYKIHHWVADQSWKVEEVEYEMGYYVRDHDDTCYLHTQRADLIVKDIVSGLYYIVDHKTTGFIGPKLISNYSMGAQFVGYRNLGAFKYGEEFGGVIINLIEISQPKGQLKIKFKRQVVEAGIFARDSFKHTVLHANRTEKILTQIYGNPRENALAWPAVFSETEPCEGPYQRPCPYRELCMRGG